MGTATDTASRFESDSGLARWDNSRYSLDMYPSARLLGSLILLLWFPLSGLAQQPKASKSGVKPDSFETILKKVMAASEDNFQSMKGKNGDLPDSTGHLPILDSYWGDYHSYYVKVTIPGFFCALLERRYKAGSPPALLYSCVMASMNNGGVSLSEPTLTEAKKRAYGDLVNKVTLATGLPSHARDFGLIEMQTETTPGSRKFEKDRDTMFVKLIEKESQLGPGLPVRTLSAMAVSQPYVRVSFKGYSGTGGRWQVELTVGWARLEQAAACLECEFEGTHQ